MDEVKIEGAMFLLFGQDYRRSHNEPSRGFRGKGVPRWNARKSASVYVTSEDATEEIEYEYEPDEVYVLDKNEAFDYDMDDAGTPWETEELYWNDETWDESAYYEQEADYPQDEEYEEIYATYLDARRRFADIKAARGFWPVMAVPPSSSPSTSRLPMLLPKENPPKERGKEEKVKEKEKGVSDPSTRRAVLQNELLQRVSSMWSNRPL